MSKKVLRASSEIMDRQVSAFNQKHPRLTTRFSGTKVGSLTKEEQQAFKGATEAKDIGKLSALIDGMHDPASELYLHMPTLNISRNGSIQSLQVFAYSAEVNNDTLLHKLFTKVRT